VRRRGQQLLAMQHLVTILRTAGDGNVTCIGDTGLRGRNAAASLLDRCRQPALVVAISNGEIVRNECLPTLRYVTKASPDAIGIGDHAQHSIYDRESPGSCNYDRHIAYRPQK